MTTRMLRKNSDLPTSGHNRLLYILSDATPDRYGDVIEASGWDLTEFERNPIALANHDPNFVVGKWSGLHITGGQLRGHLELVPAGVSGRIDELRTLVLEGFLPACSVGFLPIESEPRKGGVRYKRQTLAECSVVSIGANPNALQQMKSLGISKRTIEKLFIDPPVNGSLAQRQVAARRAERLRQLEQLRRETAKLKVDIMERRGLEALRLKKLLEPHEYDGMSADEIVKIEMDRQRREQLMAPIETRVKLEIETRMALREHPDAEAVIRAQIDRAFNSHKK